MNVVLRYLLNKAKRKFPNEDKDYVLMTNRDRRTIHFNCEKIKPNESICLPYKTAVTFINMIKFEVDFMEMPRS